MNEQIEDELDKSILKYSDFDVEKILDYMLKDTNYEFMRDPLIDTFKNYHVSKMEREYEKIYI
jgi:hypothetical protein